MKSAALVFFAIAVSSPVFAQSLCGSVLSTEVFNVSEKSSVRAFASAYRTAMCDEEWASASDIESTNADFGISYESFTEAYGLSGSFADNDEERSQAYSRFCSQTSEDIAFSSNFFEKYRSSDTAVKAWENCVIQSQGHFALVSQSLTLTGALVTLTKRGEGGIPVLDVHSVESVPDRSVQCFYGSTLAEEATFPDQREVSIRCLKRADLPVQFSINTNWGVFDKIELDGFSDEIADLQLEIAKLRNDLGAIGSVMVTVEALDARGYVAYDDNLRIHSKRDPNFVISRHGGEGGRYLSPYPIGTTLGPFGSAEWSLKKE